MRRFALIMFAVIALIASSCERRELVTLSNTHYVRVYIKEDIKNVTTGFHPNAQNRPDYKQPDILRLLLADPQTGKVKAERFLRTKQQDERGTYYEGYIVADPGRYNLIAYNFDTEVCIVRNYNDFNASKVYTNEIATHIRGRVSQNAMRTVQRNMQREMYKVAQKAALKVQTKADDRDTDERIVYDPDHFFLANCGDVYVPYADELDTLTTPDNDWFVAESIVKSYYLQVPVKGIEYATSSLGLISGMAGSAWLGTATINDLDPVTVYLELRPGDNKAAGLVKTKEGSATEDTPSEAIMYTTFNTFGRLPDSENGLTITFDFLTTHGGSHTQTIDITEEFNTAEAQEKHWIIVDDVVELPKPIDGPASSGGGFKPTVGEWEDVNTEIII